MRTAALALILLVSTSAAAQDRVDRAALDGTWKLEFDIRLEDADNALERMAIRMANGLLEEMEIRFAFMDEGRLRVMVDAFGDKEEEWSDWEITPEGYLRMGDSEHLKGEDTLWYLDGERLLPFDQDEDEVSGLALVRILD